MHLRSHSSATSIPQKKYAQSRVVRMRSNCFCLDPTWIINIYSYFLISPKWDWLYIGGFCSQIGEEYLWEKYCACNLSFHLCVHVCFTSCSSGLTTLHLVITSAFHKKVRYSPPTMNQSPFSFHLSVVFYMWHYSSCAYISCPFLMLSNTFKCYTTEYVYLPFSLCSLSNS